MPIPTVNINVLDGGLGLNTRPLGGLGLVEAISRETAYRDSQRAFQLMRQELDYRLHSILLPVDIGRVQAMVQDYLRQELPLGIESRVTYDEVRHQLQVNIEAGSQVYGMQWDLRELQQYGAGTYSNIFTAAPEPTSEVAAENLRGLINYIQSSDRRWFAPPKPMGESLDGPRWDIRGSVPCKTRYQRIMEGGAYRG